MPNKPATLDTVAELISRNDEAARKRFEDLKQNFEEKHSENKIARHALRGELQGQKDELHIVKGRLGLVEDRLHQILGDNSGSGGLLNKIDRAVDDVRAEVSDIKKQITSLENAVKDTPMIRRFVWGALAVISVLSFLIPLAVSIIIEYLKFHVVSR